MESIQSFTKLGLEATAILIGLTVCRWIAKTNLQNEFDEPNVISICKFCQIIKNQDTLVYEDDLVIAFEDISKTAKKHYLVCPRAHIKDVNSLTSKHVPLLEHMNRVA